MYIGTDFPTSELLSAIQPNFKSKNELQKLKYSCLKYERQDTFKYWCICRKNNSTYKISPDSKRVIHYTVPAEEEKNTTMRSVLRLGWGRDGESFVLFSTLALLLFSSFLFFLFPPSLLFLPYQQLTSYERWILSLLCTVTRTAQLHHFHAEDLTLWNS